MKWTCLYCKTVIETDADINEKHRCASCGAAMVPHSILVTEEDGQKVFDYSNRRMWLYYTNCPNTVTCQSHGQYRPSCEDLVMTPRCLTAVFGELRMLAVSVERSGNTLQGLD